MSSLIDRLEAPLTPALARKAGWALALAGAAALILWFATAPGGVRADGAPLGADFVTFHAAGRMALAGQLTQAYDTAAITVAEMVSAPGERLTYLWRYPPPFALVAAALGALPYFAAYALWTLGGLAALGTGLRRLVPGRDGWLLALGAPASLVCVLHGQTGLLTAASLAWGFALLERRPWLAGAIMGGLVCKPHFAALVPLALLLGGRWRALGGFAASASALCAASLVVFGPEPWFAFLKTAPDMVRILGAGGLSWAKVPSAFTLGLSIGAPLGFAWALQIGSALTAIAATGLAWRIKAAPPLCAAITVASALLLSPYLFDYDLTLVSVATALTIASGVVERRGVKLALFGGLATAAIAPPIAQLTGVQIGALPLLGLTATLAATCWSQARTAADQVADVMGPAGLAARVIGRPGVPPRSVA